MIQYTATIGGKDTPNRVRQIPQRMMSKDLCKEFNLTGAKGKLALGHLINFMAVLIGAVRCHDKTARENNVESAIKVWLRGPRDREGGRLKRPFIRLQ